MKPPHADDDLERELRAHVDLEAEERSGPGVSPSEAYRRARVALGNQALIAEDVRDVWHRRRLNDLRQDVRFGWRQLRRKPGFALVAILTLALGIGANTAMFSVAQAALWRALPYPHPERLVQPTEVEAKNPASEWGTTYPAFQEWRARSHSFEHLALMFRFNKILSEGNEPERIAGMAVSGDYFAVFGVAPAKGRALTAQDDRVGAPLAMVLSHDMWADRYHGDPTILGRTVNFGGGTFTVVGVMPAGFGTGFNGAPIACWVSLLAVVPPAYTARANLWAFEAIGRLRPGRTAAQAQAELEQIMLPIWREHPDTNRGLVIAVPSLRASITGDIREALLVLLAAAGLVLLIACANLAVLVSVQVSGRSRELALRAALGAGRVRVAFQLLIESGMLAAAGGLAGVVIAYWATRSLAGFSQDPRLLHAGISAPVLGFALCATIATTVVAGVVPALPSGRARQEALNGRTGAQPRRTRLQRAFVAAEIALCLVLLVGAALLLQTLRNVLRVNAGFRTDHLIVMELGLPSTYNDAQSLQFYRALPARLDALPGVTAGTVVSNLPLDRGSGNGDIHIEGRAAAPGELGVANFQQPLPGYFRTMGISILEGRDFDGRDDGSRERVVIINHHMAQRFWPGASPIGKRIKIGPAENNSWMTIVGVVDDVHRTNLDNPMGYSVYTPLLAGAGNNEDVAVRTAGDPAVVIPEVRAELRRLAPGLLIDHLGTMDQRIDDSVNPHRLNLILFGLFAGLALTLACIGLYGVIAYAVGQRTHEFGVRMALGARRAQVLRDVLGHGLALIAGGIGLGLVLTLSLAGLIRTMLFGVSPTDPATTAAVALLLAAVGLAACWIPARRATRIDPTVALRNE
ncbi:MAG TPA: ABC transporter permease [Terriglobales bacterium]|nr:ABC transporter permease [Terriglobales bacterium]